MRASPKEKIHDRTSTDLPINAIVVPAIVDDPYETGAKLRAWRNVRDDPVAHMRHRNQLDDAQFNSARLWQAYREASTIGGANLRAIDPTREAVDGGRFKEPFIDGLSKALAELARANFALEPYDVSLVYDVLARNMTITEIAKARSVTSGRQISYLMERFRGALDTLAKLWGLA